jgi:DegV family protein with EDD domain
VPDIAVITDSIACLTKELVAKYGIEIIPITVLVDGKVYRDWIDITPSQAYELFLKEPDSFKTAPATPEECLDIFHRASQKAKDIVCVTVSYKISTLYNMVRIAIEKSRVELPETRIELIDSQTATAAEGFVVLAAARAVLQGKNLGEVLEAANQVKNKVNTLVLLDTVKYVYRSGRVPRIAAQAASMLNIHPIFTISGTVRYATAAGTKSHGIERMLKMMRDKVGDQGVHCAVMHAYDLQEAERLKERISAEFNCIELWVTEFSPIMGYATGTGTLGLAFYTD